MLLKAHLGQTTKTITVILAKPRLPLKQTNSSQVFPLGTRLPSDLIYANKGKEGLENLCLPFGYKYILKATFAVSAITFFGSPQECWGL